MKSVSKLFLATLVAACALVPSISNAANVNYTIDESRSFMQLNNAIDASSAGLGLITTATTPQFAGSDIAIPTGSISAIRTTDIDLNEFLTLTGSSFTYLNNPTPIAPGYTNGTTEPAPQPPSTGPAQWGFNLNLFNGIVGPTAIRDMFTSVTMGEQFLFGGFFDASQVELDVLSVHNDFSYTGPGLPPFGIGPIDEWTGGALPPGSAMNSSFNGSVTLDGLVETLFLEIDLTVSTFVGDVPVGLVFTGEIYATRVVPEPGTIAMAALGMIGLVTVGYRARKRNA